MKFIWTFCIERWRGSKPVELLIELVGLTEKLSRELELCSGIVVYDDEYFLRSLTI